MGPHSLYPPVELLHMTQYKLNRASKDQKLLNDIYLMKRWLSPLLLLITAEFVLILNLERMGDTSQCITANLSLCLYQISPYSLSPTWWKLLTPSTQRLVNILSSQIWLCLFSSVPVSEHLCLHLWRDLRLLYLLPLGEPQHHCQHTQSLQAGSGLYPPCSGSTGMMLY